MTTDAVSVWVGIVSTLGSVVGGGVAGVMSLLMLRAIDRRRPAKSSI